MSQKAVDKLQPAALFSFDKMRTSQTTYSYAHLADSLARFTSFHW
jgi:hypothetical protein